MSYKRIKVYDGTDWQLVGAQVPGVFDKIGSDTVTLVSGTATKEISFSPVSFPAAPFVYVQLTGSNNATIRVSATTTTTFTVVVTGTGTDTVTFNWFAIAAV